MQSLVYPMANHNVVRSDSNHVLHTSVKDASLVVSKKYPYLPYTRFYGLNPPTLLELSVHSFLYKLAFKTPHSPQSRSVFPMIFLGVGVNIL